MFTLEMLPAHHGDGLWIEYGDPARPRRVLIDAGTVHSYKALRARLEQRLAPLPLEQRHFELLVVTHIDADHIGGVLELLIERPFGVTFGDVWFNGWDQLPKPSTDDQLGAVQGEQVSAIIQRLHLPHNIPFDGKAVVVQDAGALPKHTLVDGLVLTLLSPTLRELRQLRPKWKTEVEKNGLTAGSAEDALEKLRQKHPGDVPEDLLGDEGAIDVAALAAKPFSSDGSLPNATSIVVLAEFEGRRCLLAGDGVAGVLERTVPRLGQERGEARPALDAFKLPHHGSKANVSRAVIESVRCERFLISTNGTIFKHPDREAIARVLTAGRSGAPRDLIFNYRTERNTVWDDVALKQAHAYRTIYPEDGVEGIKIAV